MWNKVSNGMMPGKFSLDRGASGFHARILSLVLVTALGMVSPGTWSEEDDFFDDEEPVIVYLKKIRDNNGVYLREVTKGLAKSISKSGEYSVKRYNPSTYKAGPVITVSAPGYDVSENSSESTTKKVTNASIKMVSSLGGLFGKDKEVEELKEVQTELNDEEGMLNMIPDNVEVLVQLRSNVSMVDSASGAESSIPIFAEQTYSDKQEYLDQRDELFSKSLYKAVMTSLADLDSGDEF